MNLELKDIGHEVSSMESFKIKSAVLYELELNSQHDCCNAYLLYSTSAAM